MKTLSPQLPTRRRPAVYNPVMEGMLLQYRWRSCPHSADAFFLLPVDIPTVRVSTLRLMMESASSNGILHPLFRGKRGHPPLIAAALAPHILDFSGEGGLRAFFDGWATWNQDFDVADEGVLMDMDTPQDFEKIHRR